MEINEKLLSYLSDTAAIELEEDAKEAQLRDLEAVIGFMETLVDFDAGLAPQVPNHSAAAEGVLRPDTVTNENMAEELLAGAPDRKGPYIRVPRTVEE